MTTKLLFNVWKPMILMQKALFIPNAYYLISTSNSMENAAEKYHICLHCFECLE